MRLPNPKNWNGEDVAKPLTNEATPPANVTLLVMAEQYTVDAATTPYVGCCRLTDGFLGVNVMVAPGAKQGRGAVTIAWNNSNAAVSHNPSTGNLTGGMYGNDYTATKHPGKDGDMTRVFQFAPPHQLLLVTGSAGVNNAPSTPIDRHYELQALGHPYVEAFNISNSVGFSMCVSQQVENLETL